MGNPAYQGRHIGLELISRTLDYIQKDVMEGETVMVSLMAAYQRESFYEKFGFVIKDSQIRLDL